jgi:hypothetical protein
VLIATDSSNQPRLSDQLLFVAVVAALIGAGVVIARYGLDSFLPGLVVDFGASLAAFLLALTWERDQELQRLERGAAEVEARNETEVRRRLTSVHAELEVNQRSLTELQLDPEPTAGRTFTFLDTELLEGAWTANAPQLSELLADFDLVGDLAITYGRLEELRWRLRARSELRTLDLDPMTAPLVDELRVEVADLLKRIDAQIEQPTVQTRGLLHRGALEGRVSVTGSIQTRVIRGDGSDAER